MISVIIPAYNEEKNIRRVIRLVKRHPGVSEVIVMDDRSSDDTIAEARKEKAMVITSTSRGKGSSMREGMMIAKNEILVFLDADIPNYTSDLIQILTAPLIADEADFVKSFFSRQAGRVTELLVKPLLEQLFPHLLEYNQPLSGMVAGRKSFLEKVEFENDYGVDIGLLIDMHHVNARIKEVNIGSVENDMQSLHALGGMAKQVARAIFKRVAFLGPHHRNEQEVVISPSEHAMSTLKKISFSRRKMIVFDMDNTLLRGSFIRTAADKFGFRDELDRIAISEKDPIARTKQIGGLLKGRTFGELIQIVETIPLIHDAVHVIQTLKKKGYVCGIISDSYQCVVSYIQNIVGMDFALGNELLFNKSIATGEVRIPPEFLNGHTSQCEHRHCKSNILISLLSRTGTASSEIIAVGDGENDMCMIQLAGVGVALNPTYPLLPEVSDHVLRTTSLRPILDVLG